jgi:hypothetical protein
MAKKKSEESTFTCKMEDGSIFMMPNPHWQKAFEMKYGKGENKKIKKIFARLTAKHWKNKTEPTKYDFDEAWNKKYKNHAELGSEVMYQYIRTALMGIAFSMLSGCNEAKVIGLNKDGTATTYSGSEKKKYKNLEVALCSHSKTRKKKK